MSERGAITGMDEVDGMSPAEAFHAGLRVGRAENERLREFVTWVDTWVSNPVGSYSVAALDGLFSVARDRIAELSE